MLIFKFYSSVKETNRHPIPIVKRDPTTIKSFFIKLHVFPTFIPTAKFFTNSKIENTEMPSHRPMELPKSFNKETGVNFLTLLVTLTDGLKLRVTVLCLFLLSGFIENLLVVSMLKVVQDLGQKVK